MFEQDSGIDLVSWENRLNCCLVRHRDEFWQVLLADILLLERGNRLQEFAQVIPSSQAASNFKVTEEKQCERGNVESHLVGKT